MNRSDLSALREKYEEMLRLRLDGETVDPRPAMAVLASRFPGALREIDDLPLAAIEARVRNLRAAEDGGPAEPWMEATHLFHTLTRGALCAKRWLAGRKEIDDEMRAAFEHEVATFCWADDARVWQGELARLASPPRGRVTELVYEQMSARLGVTADEARMLVFGLTRRERHAGGSS